MVNALVVDNDFYNRDLCALVLKRSGYQVSQTSDGKDALSLLSQHNFDLLILDLHMPGMSGIDVIRAVKSTHSNPSMIIIVTTAYPHMSSSEVVFNGADYVIYKPINIKAFAQLAKQIAVTNTP